MIAVGRSDGRTVGIRAVAYLVMTVWPSVRLTAQCPDGTPPPCRGARAAIAAPPANSVAVLYLDNLSRDTASAWLADGLTEEMIVRLGQVRRIDVKSRFESQRVRGATARDPRELGRALRAAYLVTGSLQQAGQRVRLSVSLVRTASGSQVWGNVYDRSGSDILQIQSDIAGEVARAITGQLLPAEQTSLARQPTRDPVAYDLYLRGIGAANSLSESGLRAGLELFDRAIARDSGFADAYARQAMVWLFLADSYVEGRVGYQRSREAAERTLRLDSTQSLAWAMLTWAALALDFDAVQAERLARRAVALDPRQALAHGALGTALMHAGHLDRGLIETRRGWQADTLSAFAATIHQYLLQLAHQPDTIATLLPRMQQALAPEDVRQYDGWVRLRRGDAAGAAERLTWPYFGGWFAAERVQALLALGRRDEARAVVDSVRTAADRGYFNAFTVAKVYAAAGNPDSAFAWLGRAVDQRTLWLIGAPDDDVLMPLHGDPRFTALLRRIGR